MQIEEAPLREAQIAVLFREHIHRQQLLGRFQDGHGGLSVAHGNKPQLLGGIYHRSNVRIGDHLQYLCYRAESDFGPVEREWLNQSIL